MAHRHNQSLGVVRERHNNRMYAIILLSIATFAIGMYFLEQVGRVDPDSIPVVVTVSVHPTSSMWDMPMPEDRK